MKARLISYYKVYPKRCLAVLLVTCTFHTTSAQPIRSVSDKFEPATSAVIKGFVGEKLDAAYNNRILAQDINRLIEPFNNRTEDRCWQSEFWDK